MMRNIFLTVLIVVVVTGGGFFFYREFTRDASKDSAPTAGTQDLVPVTDGQVNGETGKRYHQAVSIDSQSFFFNPGVFRVKRGEKVTVSVRAHGDHAFVIDELNVNAKTPDGITAKIEFTPEKEGAFRYYCDKPGHREAGQAGVMIVE